MKIKDQKINNAIVLEINGRIDTSNYGKIDEVFSKHLNKNENNIIVDFKEMDYISSSGLRILLTTFKKIKAKKGNFMLCSLQENIKEIFDISGFTNIFKIFANQEEAIKEMI